ncbi:MAG: M48 family metallopeptidase [Methylococcales bacterium]
MPCLILFLTLYAGGCTTNRITGRTQASLVSDAEAARQSAQAYNQVLTKAKQGNALDVDSETLKHVRAIADPIIVKAQELRPETRNWKWAVHVLKQNEVNAWCMAGGKIAVYTGLLDQIKPTDDELAQVLGHEISHALLSHQAEKLSRAMIEETGMNLAVAGAAIAGYDVKDYTDVAKTIASVGLQLPNSREAESEADNYGIELAAKAGYNPNAAVSLWQKMISATGGSGGSDWLSTHPSPGSRIQNLKARAAQLMPVYKAAHASAKRR